MIGVGIVGLGNIGKRHLEIINNSVHFEAVAYTNLIEHRDISLNYHDSIESLIQDDKADVIAICTPNGLHADHALKCLKAKKHVLVEKPMATNKVDCEAIIKGSLDHGKYVFCMMQNRCSQISQELKRIIDQKLLGDIYMIDIRCFWNRGRQYYEADNGSWRGTSLLDGGTLFTQFAHYVDLIYWLFGDIDVLNASFNNANHQNLIEFEDTGAFQFQCLNALGSFQYTTSVWDKNFESTLTLIGEKGTIKVGGQYMQKLEYCHIQNYTFPDVHVDNKQNMSKVYQNIYDVLNGEKTVTTNAMDGLKVVEIIEKIYAFKK